MIVQKRLQISLRKMSQTVCTFRNIILTYFINVTLAYAMYAFEYLLKSPYFTVTQ